MTGSSSSPGPNPSPAGNRPLRRFDGPSGNGLGGAELAAIGLGAVWLLAAAAVYLVAPEDAGPAHWTGLITGGLALVLPLAMLWVAASAARSARVIREECEQLQAAIDGLRQTYLSQSQQHAAVAEPAMVKRLEEIAEATRKTETALATFHTSRRDPQRPAIPAEAAELAAAEQGSLALGTQAGDAAPPLPAEHFIRALNFPETAEDQDGFAALRAALQDRKAAQVIQAAQDVLTLLSQDGIYMDDLRPDMARPEIWRQFAQGARGRAVAPLGGVRDRTSLALTAARMKQDPIFRDAAHHFLRRFDQMFADFETEATDGEISALGNTRTARAFMLLGRVAGTFD
ncbi:hypothetical protein [Leisingera methylohalidivorans]|uniref:Uncharacterized protein n=1 Tax=Leisingera methylohalidivorans DSM 14336 TaxID=999552 RepID=V9VR97_9RHOB|nr:hypothetical protein [Leisingera methylohalidivorans]AHC99839.1 hypothetical protein METH_03095 [Leisingera methylohalidivorans DSM 14336]